MINLTPIATASFFSVYKFLGRQTKGVCVAQRRLPPPPPSPLFCLPAFCENIRPAPIGRQPRVQELRVQVGHSSWSTDGEDYHMRSLGNYKLGSVNAIFFSFSYPLLGNEPISRCHFSILLYIFIWKNIKAEFQPKVWKHKFFCSKYLQMLVDSYFCPILNFNDYWVNQLFFQQNPHWDSPVAIQVKRIGGQSVLWIVYVD